jgi:hypothetical protein
MTRNFEVISQKLNVDSICKENILHRDKNINNNGNRYVGLGWLLILTSKPHKFSRRNRIHITSTCTCQVTILCLISVTHTFCTYQ